MEFRDSLLASLTLGKRVAVVPVRHEWGEFCHLMGPGIPTLKLRASGPVYRASQAF